MQLILNFDKWLFLKLNREWTTDWLDAFFAFLTNILQVKWFSLAVVPVILGIYFYKYRKEGLKFVISVLLMVAVTDSFSTYILKKGIGRPRPNHADIGAILKVPYGPKSKSFPSNHSLNTFAIATRIAIFYPAIRGFAFLFAALMAYSRVSVGVHYPLDILAGAIIGIILALCLHRFIFQRITWFRIRTTAASNQ